MSNSDEKRLLVKRRKGERGAYYFTALSPRDLSEISEDCFDLPFLNPKQPMWSNSCGGLLFFFDYTGHSYLCNPTTKQIQIFPPKEASRNPNYETRLAGACVGYDSTSNDYKILRIWDRNYWPSGTDYRERSFELYSLSSDSWEEITSPAPKCLSGIDNVIYARGKLYWISPLDLRVVSFDCSKKSFSYLSLPRKADYTYFTLVKFHDDDLLGIAFRGPRGANHKLPFDIAFGSEPGFYYEVWALSKELPDSWDKMFNVSLGGGVGGVTAVYGPFFFLSGMARDTDANRLVVYDWTKKECKELDIYNYVSIFGYVESNVALPHGKPINESPILDYGYVDECRSMCSSPYDSSSSNEAYDSSSSNEAQKADRYHFHFDFDYDSSNEAQDANSDDFAVNGLRILNDIELEEEEEKEKVVTHGNMPYAYRAKILSEGRVKTGTGKRQPASSITSGCNNVYFPMKYTNAKFFVIKSDSEDDVRNSIKCKMWSCSPYGNKKLNAAYEDAQGRAARDCCPIFLFFTVNGSGNFCGVAEMSGPVDFNRDMDFWQRSGSFPVKWYIIKDLIFSYKILQNMSVTDSRDIQRISYRKGDGMLEIFISETSIFEVGMSYEHKQSRKRARRRG